MQGMWSKKAPASGLPIMQKIDPRHQARKLALLKLFSEFYRDNNEIPAEVVSELPQTTQADLPLLQNLVEGVKSRSEEIDRIITESAPEWPLDRIARIDLAILRISVYELTVGQVNPSVAINEAVELAKEFGGENSGKFVNGVLGNVAESLNKEKQ